MVNKALGLYAFSVRFPSRPLSTLQRRFFLPGDANERNEQDCSILLNFSKPSSAWALTVPTSGFMTGPTGWLLLPWVLRHQTVSLYEKTDSKPKMKRFLLVILGPHLVSRHIITQPYYDYGERMPFYSCTLAAVILFVMNIRPPKKRWQHDLMDWAAFAGIYGGVLAIGFSSPGVYLAPHITGADYFIGHAMIIIFGLICTADRDKLFSARELKSSTLITVIYMLISVVINHFAGTNYAS